MSVQCILEGQQDNTKFDKAGGIITGDVIIEGGNKICNSSQFASIQLNGDNTSGTISLTSENQNNASGSSMQLENNLAVLSATNGVGGAEGQTNAITLTGTQTTIKNVVTPTEDGDAANKYYVDQHAGGGVPTNHASTDKTYGAGSETEWGHVRLTDQYDDGEAKAADGVAVSPWGVYQVYSYANEINDSKAQTNHASTATTYGTGTSSNYGHVKLSDSYNSTSGASSGVAATPNAVKTVHDLADGKAPKSHASTTTTYGTGSSTNYGHVKLSASTSSTSGTSNGVAATPSAVKAVHDLLGGKKIVCGWNSVNYAASQRDTTIQFPSGSFNNPPVVIIGQPFNGVVCTVFHNSVKNNQFTVNVPGISGASASTRDMAWIAIGT